MSPPNNWIRERFGRRDVVIGMLHCPPLPGSPGFASGTPPALDMVLADASVLVDGGVDALLIENHGDMPFAKNENPPHVAAWMAVIATAVKSRFGVPIGINVLRNDAFSALGAAVASGADFIRVNVLTGVTATDQGLIEGCAAELLRYRKSLCSTVAIFADLEVKYGTPLYRTERPVAVASTFERGLADAVIVTGPATGSAPKLADLEDFRQAVADRALVAGSGVTTANVASVFKYADAAIVGSSLKHGGNVGNAVDVDRVRSFMTEVHRVRAERSPQA